MSFATVLFTTKGRALQSKSLAGTALRFTRIGMGAGSLGGQSQVTLNAMIDPKVYINVNKVEKSSNYAIVEGNFLNSDVSTGFYWRELGIYAYDPDLGEILYCYGNAGALAEYIPPQSEEIVEKVVRLSVIVGDNANITVQTELAAFATKKELLTKWEIYISEGIPEIGQRKDNTLYFKITDTITQGGNSNIIVSPTMGLKFN